MHQNRNNGYVARERRSDFQPHEIVGIVETTFAVGVRDRRPLGSDDRKKYAAAGDVVVDGLAKVQAGSDSGDVHEDGIVAVSPDEIVIESSCLAFRVISPITDKNRMLHRCSSSANCALGGSWSG